MSANAPQQVTDRVNTTSAANGQRSLGLLCAPRTSAASLADVVKPEIIAVSFSIHTDTEWVSATHMIVIMQS